jgi:hypothetical protein
MRTARVNARARYPLKYEVASFALTDRGIPELALIAIDWRRLPRADNVQSWGAQYADSARCRPRFRNMPTAEATTENEDAGRDSRLTSRLRRCQKPTRQNASRPGPTSKSEWWARSSRNPGRDQIGTPGRDHRNPHPAKTTGRFSVARFGLARAVGAWSRRSNRLLPLRRLSPDDPTRSRHEHGELIALCGRNEPIEVHAVEQTA